MSEMDQPEVEWWYLRQGRQYGPVPERSLVAWLESGFMKHEDLVWRAGLDEWTALSELPEFGGQNPFPTSVPPPLPPAVSRDVSAGALEKSEGASTMVPSEEAAPTGAQNASTPPARIPGSLPPRAMESGAIAYASFGARLLAYLIDNVLMSFVLILVFFPRVVRESQSAELLTRDPVLLFGSVVLSIIYYTAFESSPWQATLGKRALRLRVTDVRGARLRPLACAARQIAKLLSAMLFYLGFLMALFTPTRQALHDVLVGSLVLQRRG